MGLSSSPFNRVTGELLPGYRDAYLRGDLSHSNTTLVDAYLQSHSTTADQTWQRFHSLRAAGHAVRPVGWVRQQLHLLRTEPVRFRRRVASLLLLGVLVSGVVLASHRLPGSPVAPFSPETTGFFALEAAEASGLEMPRMTATLTTVKGRILDENGRPLVGATVIDKRSGRGVSTDGAGNYALLVPTYESAQLQFAYGGYEADEVQTRGRGVHNMTLLPDAERMRKDRKSHWWHF